MAVRKVELELEQLGRMREAPPDEALAALRKALKDPVNMMAAKAASIAAARGFRELLPELLRAFERLFGDAVRRDPKCWGKNAIAKALTELEYRESGPYLRGMRHVQMEPVWGGEADTADILRGICVLGMVASSDIPREEAFRALVDAAGDPAEPVRVEAVRGIAQMDGEEAILLLRMMARKGDSAPAVMGQVFDCLLVLEGAAALPFVVGFFRSGADEVREEAILSMGGSRLPDAVPLLREAWEDRTLANFREVVLRALSLSGVEDALAFLLDLVRDGRVAEAVSAVDALALRKEMRQQVEEAASGREAEVREAVRTSFGEL